MIRRQVRLTMVAAIAAGALVLCGCQNNKTAAKSAGKSTVAMGTLNDKCPVSDKPVATDGGTATWRGHTIGFCCPNCPSSWNAMTAKDKDAFVAKYTKP